MEISDKKIKISDSGASHHATVTTPTAIPGYWSSYVKPDNIMYYQDGVGAEHQISEVGFEVMDDSISPPALTGNTDNWEPTGLESTRVVRISALGNYELRGLKPLSGRKLVLIPISGGDIKLVNNAATSLEAWRFLADNDLVVKINQAATIWYDPIDNRWRIIGYSV